MSRKKSTIGEDYRKVTEVVKDHIFTTHTFPQITDIAKQSGIPKLKCTSICNELIGQNRLYKVFWGTGLATVVIPYDMMQMILRIQAKPKWMDKYSFKEKNKLDKKVEELTSQITDYEMFERLLYMTDIPLQEAVSFALEWLGFENVIHFKEDTDNPDVTFTYQGLKALVEVEGTIKAGDKNKAQQLEGWVKREIVEHNKKAAELKGFFVVNHFREIEPQERSEPLTPHAKEYLKLNQSHFFTTYFLFDTVKTVMDGLSKDEARKKVWNGEKID
jgi:hypothetical protein